MEKIKALSKEDKIVLSVALVMVIIVAGIIIIKLQEVGVGVGVGNVAPSIDSVALKDTGENFVSTLDPYTEYYVYVTVTDQNTLLDLKEIRFVMYSYQSSLSDSDSVSDHYTFIYNATSDSWIAGISDTIIETDCLTPTDLSGASGTYRLAFRLLLARASTPVADQWTLEIIVIDNNNANATYTTKFDVRVYGQISLSATQLAFYGQPADQKVPSDPQFIVVTVYANWNWELLIRGEDLVNPEKQASIPVSNLYIDDDPNPVEDTETGATIQSLSLDFTIALGQSGGYANGMQINIYFYIDIPSPLPSGTYSGKIYFALSLG